MICLYKVIRIAFNSTLLVTDVSTKFGEKIEIFEMYFHFNQFLIDNYYKVVFICHMP